MEKSIHHKLRASRTLWLVDFDGNQNTPRIKIMTNAGLACINYTS